MRFTIRRAALTVAAIAAVAISPTMAGFAAGAVNSGVTITPAVITLGGQTPTVVLNHQAVDLGTAASAQPLAITLVLPLRNQTRLTQFLATQDTTRQVMTPAQIADLFLPEQSRVDVIRAWAALHGLHVSAVSANRTLVTLQGTTRAVDAALSVQTHNYRSAKGQRFFSNDRDATVPATLGITAVSGLNDLDRFQTTLSSQPLKAALAHAANAVYEPANFRTAYNVTHNGNGQTIGFTLWGTSVLQADLNRFAFDTGDPAIVAGQSGANGIDWIFPTPALIPPTYQNDVLDETAMDVEYAHAIAPNSHLKYYLGDESLIPGCTSSPTTDCYTPTNIGLENAVAAAASPSDPNMHVVSNSWLGSEPLSSTDSFLVATQQSFQLAKAAGITFYFASGDTGSNSGGTGAPAYPADSPYVVAVGGTTLTFNAGAYGSETAWSGSGGGCSMLSANARPSWQVFTGTHIAPTCGGRAEPDVSADADPNTGAYVDYDGGSYFIGGTSLATPLWAGMTAAADSLAVADGRTVLSFTGPVIYGCANNASPYPANCRSAYHDVTSGNNGADSAGAGWDEATGWGSINWDTWAQDVVLAQPLVGATPIPTSTTTATSTPAVGGSLVGANSVAPSAVNLTSEGTADWTHWGLSSATSFDHKANVSAQLGTYTLVNGGSVSQASVPTQFSWSDGTPDSTSGGTGTAVSLAGVGQGFALNLPADLTSRTVHIYAGVYRAGATFTATLSDGSAPAYTMSTLNNLSGQTVEEYTLTYHAATAGQTLHISFTMTTNHSFGNVSLAAVTLIGGSGGAPSSTPTTTPSSTPSATATGTATPTVTATLSATTTKTITGTPSVTATRTATALGGSVTSTATGTATPTGTPTGTSTATSTPTGTSTATPTPSATVVVGVGSLTGSAGTAPGTVNLTSEGTADWAHWGLSSSTSFDHKASVASQLSTYTLVNGGSVSQASVPTQFSWSDGTPDTTSGGTGTAVSLAGVGQGFALTLPADLTPRTVHIYAGVYRAGATFTATLSDGSAPAYTMSTLNNLSGQTVEEYTLTYHAATAGQTLHLNFTMTTNHSFGNVSLAAVTLTGGSGGAPSSTPTTTPSSTPSATATGTATPTVTATLSATATNTATRTATALVGSVTSTATPTSTPTGTSTATSTASPTPSATVAVGVGSLVGLAGTAPGTVNLTGEGTADWAHWGLSSSTSFDHKASVASQLSTYTLVNGGSVSQASVPTQFSWSDGTPDGTSGGTGTAVSLAGVGQGFALTLPADLTPRTVHVYAGVYRAGATFTATLSDGSTPAYSMSTLNNLSGQTVEEYTLTYHAATAGQTLHISFTMTTNHSFGSISLAAATLR